MRKQLATDLSRVDVNEILNQLLTKKSHFSFSDIEKEYKRTLTTADKFLIRCVVIKKFNLNIEYLASNQLKFYRKKECFS